MSKNTNTTSEIYPNQEEIIEKMKYSEVARDLLLKLKSNNEHETTINISTTEERPFYSLINKVSYNYNPFKNEFEYKNQRLVEIFGQIIDITPFISTSAELHRKKKYLLGELFLATLESTSTYEISNDTGAKNSSIYQKLSDEKYMEVRDKFLQLYSNEGMAYAMKWVNRLNNEDDINVIATEYIAEIKELKNNNSIFATEKYERFFLRILAHYSPKALLFGKIINEMRYGEETKTFRYAKFKI